MSIATHEYVSAVQTARIRAAVHERTSIRWDRAARAASRAERATRRAEQAQRSAAAAAVVC